MCKSRLPSREIGSWLLVNNENFMWLNNLFYLSRLMLSIGMRISLRHRLHQTYRSPLPLTSSYLNSKGCFRPSSLHRGHNTSPFIRTKLYIISRLCKKNYKITLDFIIFAPNSEPQSHLTPSGQVAFAVFKQLWRSEYSEISSNAFRFPPMGSG